MVGPGRVVPQPVFSSGYQDEWEAPVWLRGALRHQHLQLEHVHAARRGGQQRVRQDKQPVPAQECLPWIQVSGNT